LFCLGGLAVAANAGEMTDVDLQLVLAADTSVSMNPDELRLQRDGYVAAFRHRDLADAILSGPLGRVAVIFVEWSGPADQAVVVPWTILADRKGIADFANRLAAATTGRRGIRTALSSGLLFAAQRFGDSGVRSKRKVIDVSGDGIGNDGPPLDSVRAWVGDGITINGLSVVLPETDIYGPFAAMFGSDAADVHAYYRDQVIGGPGAFAIAVNDINDFAAAIRRKLVREIAWR
jgi:hypothetical protein